MEDLRVRRGLSTELFQLDSNGKLNYELPNTQLIKEEGCWYLCTDTAELFLCASEKDEQTHEEVLVLKKINKVQTTDVPGSGETIVGITGAYINEASGELYVVFSDGTEKSLGIVVGAPGKDGLVTAIKIGNQAFEHTDGIIELPSFVTDDELDAKGYLTEHQSLAGLATETYVNNKIAAIPKLDLNEYAKKADIPDVSDFITEVPAEYVTETELNNKGYLTEHQDLSEYAKKVELPSIEGLATEAFVLNKIAEAELNDKDVDLSGYATKDEIKDFASTSYVDDKVAKIEIPSVPKKVSELENDRGYITAIPAEYITEEELASKGYLTEHQSLEGLATEQYVIDAIANQVPVENLAKKEEVEEVKATLETDVLPAVEQVEQQILPTVQKVETEIIPTVQELVEKAATQSWVVDQKYLQNKYEVLPVEGMLVLYGDNEVRLNTERVKPTLQNVGATGNANMYYVTFRAYAPEGATRVIEGQSDKMDTEFTSLATDNTGRKYTTIWAAIANTSDGGQTWAKWGDSSTIDKYLGFYYNFHWYSEDTLIGTDKVRVILTNDKCHNDLVPDAIARRIDDKVKAIDIPDVNLDGYAKKSDIPDVSNFITISDVEAKGYLTEVPSEYVTGTELDEKGYLTETALNNYYTKEQSDKAITAAVVDKANSIPFTTDKYVTKAFGGFKIDDNLKGFTIADILAKLLELSDLPSQEPELPSEPDSIVENIMKNELPMYQVNADGQLVAVPYTMHTLTEEQAEAIASEAGFYQIVNNSNEVLESGYQQLSVINPDVPYMIALPSIIDFETHTEVEQYNELESEWTPTTLNLTDDKEIVQAVFDEIGLPLPEVPEGYILLINPEEGNNGAIYRFIIKE